MVVEQEMAVIYPPDAEAFSEFLPETDCGRCGYGSCIEFSEAVLSNKISSRECPELDTALADVMASIIKLNMDPIPYNCMMEQVPCELIEINHPNEDAPLLVTCNFRETVRIMQTILESTHTPAFLLPTFTHGYSVDNASSRASVYRLLEDPRTGRNVYLEKIQEQLERIATIQ